MIYLPRNVSTEDVLQVIQAWVELWAELGPEAAFSAIALDENDTWTPEWLEYATANYRPLELYPDAPLFVVTAPDTAMIASHVPTREVQWYNPKNTGLVGDIRFDLPLNGRWSDLLAEFDLWGGDALDKDYLLTLDEIRCWDQFWSEEEKELEHEAT